MSDHACYEEKYVVCLDLLGWSELLCSSALDSRPFALALSIQSSLAEIRMAIASHLVSVDSHPGAPRIDLFSDTLLISLPYGSELRWVEDATIELCKRVARATLAHGVLVRGAVCRGSLFHDPENHVCFGPALVRAHHLEKHVAKYPRIIIDPSIAASFVAAEASDKPLKPPGGDPDRTPLALPHRCLRLGADGLVYVDYLGPDIVNDQGDPFDDEERSCVRTRLEQAARAAAYDHAASPPQRVREKLDWFRAHANQVAAETGCASGTSADRPAG